MGWNPLNDLQYEFGGGRATQEAAAAGTLDPNSLKPNLLQRVLGTSEADLKRARYQGELQRFNESGLSQEAEQYGVTPSQVGSGRVNVAEIRTNVDNAKELKSVQSLARAEGVTQDLTGMQTGDIQSLIRGQRTKNQIADAGAVATAAFNNPQARFEREKNETRYLDQQRTSDRRYYDSLRRDSLDRKERAEMEDRRLRREDMRYNESIDRANKKDRRMAMQSLAGGLAALGAAFAI